MGIKELIMKNKWKVLAIASISILTVTIFIFAFVFYSFSVPDTRIEIKLMDVSSDKIVLNISFNVENKNPFPLIMKKLDAKIIGNGEKELAEFPLSTGIIPSKNSRRFYGNYEINFKGDIPQTATIIINGNVGAKFLFKKSLNVGSQIDIFLSPIQNISLPRIFLNGEIKGISDRGVNFHYSVTFKNPNFYGVYGKNVFFSIINENGSELYNKSIAEFYISSNNSLRIEDNLIFPLKILNYKNITLSLHGGIYVKVGGIKKEMKLHSKAVVRIPEIKEIMQFPGYKIISNLENFDIISTAPPVVHIKTNLSLEINNPNSYSIQVDNISISLYSIYYFREEKIGEGFIRGGVVKANSIARFHGSFTADITLFQFWPPFPNPPEMRLHIKTMIGIKGVKEKLPLEIEYYQIVKI